MSKTSEKIKTEARQSVVKSAIYFASGTLMSKITGLLRDALLVAIFGKTISDAWLAAFRFPNLFRRIFGEGALSACFIPVYVDYKHHQNREAQAQLTAGILGLLLSILIPLTLFFVVGMEQLVPLWVGGKGFSEVPGKIELTITMTKIMFPFLLLMSLYAFFMAVLNAHKKFLLSSLAPLFLNLIIIAASLYCYSTGKISGVILSWAVIVGGCVQFLVLVPSFLQLNVPFEWRLSNLLSLPVRRVLKAFLPSVLGLGIVQFMALINVNFASQLNEGSVTFIYLADRLLELPLSLVAVSLGTALLPTLSEKISQRDDVGFQRELFSNIKVLLFLCLPAAAGLWMISDLLVSVIFERGAFGPDQAVMVSMIVQINAFTLIGASLSRVLGQSFYAEKRTMIPGLASGTGLIFHVIAAPYFIEAYGLSGLVTSTAISAFINCTVLFIVFTRLHGTLFYKDLFIFVARAVLASSVIVGICWGLRQVVFPEGFTQKLGLMLALVTLSAVGYFTAASALQMREAQTLLRRLSRRGRR